MDRNQLHQEIEDRITLIAEYGPIMPTFVPSALAYLQGVYDCGRITKNEFASYKSRIIALFMNSTDPNFRFYVENDDCDDTE